MKDESDCSALAVQEELEHYFLEVEQVRESLLNAHKDELKAFFSGLGAAVDIARRTQAELDRRAATRFSVFAYFHERETDLSRIFGGLLNPVGAHGQGGLFLGLFLEEIRKAVDEDVRDLFPSGQVQECTVHLEHHTDEGRSIDIVLEMPGDVWIGIENKPWAREQHNQITDYLRYLRSKAGPDQETDAWVVYLSGDGETPKTLPDEPEEKRRCATVPYRSMDRTAPCVESWLRKCRSECEAERVRWFLTDLLEYVKREFEQAYRHGEIGE